MIIVSRLISKISAFIMFLGKHNAGVFKFLRFEERFGKALFFVTDGRPNP